MAHGVSASRGRLGVLVRLHFLLTWRPQKRGGASDWAGGLLLVLLASLVGLMAFGVSFGMTMAASDKPAVQELVLWAGAGVLLLFYVLMGSMAETVAGGIDVSLLFHYPVTQRDMVLSELIARIAGPASFPGLGFFAGCAAGGLWAGRPALALAALLALLIWLVQANLLMMALDYALFHIRRSRRFGEALALAGSALFVGLILLQNIMAQHAAGASSQGVALSVPGWLSAAGRVLVPLAPLLPGASAASWIVGGWAVIPRAGVAGALIAGLFAADRLLLMRLAQSGAVESGRRPAGRAVDRHVARGRRRVDRFLPWPFFVKDLRYLARDPLLRTSLLSIVALPFFVVFIINEPSGLFAGAWFQHFGFLLFLLLALSRFATNNLAIERSGLGLVLGSPVPRWAVLAGKNMALMALFLCLLVVPMGFFVWKGMPPAEAGATVLTALATCAVYLGLANLLAVLMPVPVAPRGRRLMPQVSGGVMFLLGLLNVAVVAATEIALLPLLLGRLAFSDAPGPVAGLLLALAGVLYGLVLYLLLLAWASRLMERRESAIYEALVRGS